MAVGSPNLNESYPIGRSNNIDMSFRICLIRPIEHKKERSIQDMGNSLSDCMIGSSLAQINWWPGHTETWRHICGFQLHLIAWERLPMPHL